MLIAHIIILIGFGSGIKIPLYLLAYPIVYSSLVFVLTRRKTDWWFSNVVSICLIPFLYWYLLLWSDGKINWTDAINFKDSSSMLLIIPFTFLIATLVSLTVFKNKKRDENIVKFKEQ